jgi:hypothetical protein
MLVTNASSDEIVYRQFDNSTSNWVCLNPHDHLYVGPRQASDATSEIPCELSEHFADVRNYSSSWAPFYNQVVYCLSEPRLKLCKVQSNLHIAIIVMCFNFLKAALMLYYAIDTKEIPLLTITDAVASFLQRPDEHTVDMGFLSRTDFDKLKLWEKTPKTASGIPQRIIETVKGPDRVVYWSLYVCHHRCEGIWKSLTGEQLCLPDNHVQSVYQRCVNDTKSLWYEYAVTSGSGPLQGFCTHRHSPTNREFIHREPKQPLDSSTAREHRPSGILLDLFWLQWFDDSAMGSCRVDIVF